VVVVGVGVGVTVGVGVGVDVEINNWRHHDRQGIARVCSHGS
jgi:hypothetical protein